MARTPLCCPMSPAASLSVPPFLAALAGFLFLCTEVAPALEPAESFVIRDRSPDGEFAVRYTYAPGVIAEPRGTPWRIELIRAGSKQVVLLSICRMKRTISRL